MEMGQSSTREVYWISMLPVRLAKLNRNMSRKQMRICLLDHESLRAARALRIWLLILLRVCSDYVWVRCRGAGRSRVWGQAYKEPCAWCASVRLRSVRCVDGFAPIGAGFRHCENKNKTREKECRGKLVWEPEIYVEQPGPRRSHDDVGNDGCRTDDVEYRRP